MIDPTMGGDDAQVPADMSGDMPEETTEETSSEETV